MCRLFAQISNKEKDGTDFLIEKEFSLLKQSRCNKKNIQKDGWGVAGWEKEGRRWRLAKSENALFDEKNKFKKVAGELRSKMILAHVRQASNPKKLPREQLIGLENTQPFSFKNLAFAHNGTLNIPDEVSGELGEYGRNVSGTNDSEVLFWLLVKSWAERLVGDDPVKMWKKIFTEIIGQIDSAWDRLPKNKRAHPAPFRGLNMVAGDGKSLAAFCYYRQSEGKSLCGQGRPYFQMCYQLSEGRIAVASEPMDSEKNWIALEHRHLLVAQPNRPPANLELSV